MSVIGFIQQYGYLALALGSFLEGEAVVLAAGLAAYHQHLALPYVIAIAAVASFLGDQPYFYAGRKYGTTILQRFPSLHSRKTRIDQLIERHHMLLVPSLRFLYGLRMVGLIAIGMSKLGTLPFQVINLISAFVWALAFALMGYGTGHGLEFFGEASGITQATVLATLLLFGTIAYFIRLRRRNSEN
ncbi:DedA family protein [Noviherbaspirillum saxi]|uniref:DedA family protein n=1 Tax=Noviherbaspirillum saxi TaxID=2320863 RepID=A0A3A3G6W0_9BURK|nr:DedA family protein [Noviherbaspirillum saxi]RJF95920.1 DedA family protein [Noviherbaspirillum saxi]